MQRRLHRDSFDIFALNNKEKNALKIGRPTFSIFPTAIWDKIILLWKPVPSDKNKLENHSLENQKCSLTVIGQEIW